MQHADHAVGAEDRHADDGAEAFAEPGAHDLDPGNVIDHHRGSLRRDAPREALPEGDRHLFLGDPLQPVGRANVQHVPVEHQERRAVRVDGLPDPLQERMERVLGVEPLQRGVTHGEDASQRLPSARLALQETSSLERLGRLPHHRLERGPIFGREGRFRAADREHAHGAAAPHQRDEAPAVIRSTLAPRAWVQPSSPSGTEGFLDVPGERGGRRGGDHVGIQFAVDRHDGQHVLVREQDDGGAGCTDRLPRGRQQGLDHLGLRHPFGDGRGEPLETRQALQDHPELRTLLRQARHQLIALGLCGHPIADVLDDRDQPQPFTVGTDDLVGRRACQPCFFFFWRSVSPARMVLQPPHVSGFTAAMADG